jgi:hypothetical protein
VFVASFLQGINMFVAAATAAATAAAAAAARLC